MSEIKLQPGSELREVVKRLEKVTDQLRTGLGGIGPGGGGGSSGGGSPSPGRGGEAKKPDGMAMGTVKATGEGSQHAAAGAASFEQDADELRSGRFSGILERRIQGMRDSADFIKKIREKKKRKDGTSAGPGETGEGGGPFGAGVPGAPAVVRQMRVERLVLGPHAAKNLPALGGRGGPTGRPGVGGGGPQRPNASDPMKGTSNTANNLQIAGFSVGAVVGFAMRTISSVAGMYQRAYQSQDSTLDSMKFLTGRAYQGGGGGLVSNAEMAQARLTRAKASRSGTNTKYENDLDIRFGLMTGQGAQGGAKLFGDLGRFSDGEFSPGDLRRMLRHSYGAGFGKVRSGDFLQQIASQAEQKVSRGFGTMDIEERARTAAGLRKAGLHREEIFPMMTRVDQQFQNQSSLAAQLSMASAMSSGKSFMQSRVQAEQGLTAANVKGISGLLGLSGMDKETRALLETQIYGVTATQAMRGKGSGLFGEAIKGAGSGTDGAADRDLATIRKHGGFAHRRIPNEIDQAVVDSPIAKKAFEFQKKFADTLIASAKGMNTVVEEGIETYKSLSKEMGKLTKEINEAGGAVQWARKKILPF